ncbi:hypothetical protein H4S02_003030 [Coemansia sp. RSA 2611]|nr:hypothetical protein H4S02_003030 [Coemansia sp. RSA 2611]
MQQTPRFSSMGSIEQRSGIAAAAAAAAAIMTTGGSGRILSTEASAADIRQLLVPSSTPTLSSTVGGFDPSHEPISAMTLADAAATMAATMSVPASQAPPMRETVSDTHMSGHRGFVQPLSAPTHPTLSLGSLAEAAAGTRVASSRARASTAERVDIEELELGDAEAIPSIGKFGSPRQLYHYKERVQAYEEQHGSQWRERMDSKRRQNWSRISAVYTRILQLRGPGTADADLERALGAVSDEMAQTRVTLTKYSQVIRKRLANERRQTARQSQDEQPAARASQLDSFGAGQ